MASDASHHDSSGNDLHGGELEAVGGMAGAADSSAFLGNGSSQSPGVPQGSGGTGGRRPIPPKFYRIGEVVEYSGMSRQTIHNYTTMGLLHESAWTSGGHRLYDESVFQRLDVIAQFKAAHKSIQNIRDFFAHQGSA